MIDEYVMPLVQSVGQYIFTTVLEGASYEFEFQWYSRQKAWYMHIREPRTNGVRGKAVALGLKVVLGAYIGRHIDHPLFQRGVFAAFDNSGARTDAGYDDLGPRVELKYIPALSLLRRNTLMRLKAQT